LTKICDYRKYVAMTNVASKIIGKCGGAQAVAALLGLSPASVHKWKYPVERGGTGGLVPTNRQQELLDRARAAGVDLRPDDFFERPAAKSDGEAA
jgi:DNA-binding transcriptional regulator YdaS (Cro superfamily)